MDIEYYGQNDTRKGPVLEEIISGFNRHDPKATKRIFDRLDILARQTKKEADVKNMVRIYYWLSMITGYSKRQNMYELKTKAKQKVEFRLLFVVVDSVRPFIYIVHAFFKKDQKIRKNYIEVAYQRAETFHV